MKKLRSSSAVILLCFLALCVNAQESFYRVYQFETPLKGHLEMTQWTTGIFKSDLDYNHFGKQLSRQGLWAYSAEAEYGVANHFVLAGYADFEDPKGQACTYTRSRVEARYRFGERYDHFINTALYAEYYFPNHSYSNSNEIETRLILDKDFNDVRVVVNPSMSKYINGDEDKKWQPGVSAGVYYRRGKVVQPGIEYYDNFREKTPVLIPTLSFNIGGSVVWNLGAGFGLNNEHTDKFFAKSILQVDLEAIRPTKLMR